MNLKKESWLSTNTSNAQRKANTLTKIRSADNGVKKGHSVTGNPPKQSLREEESQEGGFVISKLGPRTFKRTGLEVAEEDSKPGKPASNNLEKGSRPA